MKPTRAYTVGGLRIRDEDSETEITVKIPDGALLTAQYLTNGGSLVTKFEYPFFLKDSK
jgi:hypothetical protein